MSASTATTSEVTTTSILGALSSKSIFPSLLRAATGRITLSPKLKAHSSGGKLPQPPRCRRHIEPAHARDLAARSVDARNRRFDRFERDRHVECIGVNERSFVAHHRHVPVPEQKVAAPQLRVLRKRAAERLFLPVAVPRARDAASVKRDLHEA